MLSKFKPPKSDIQEVLYLLLTEGYVSCISASYMHGFRTRVSELRRKHNLVLDAKEMHSVNRNGNLFTYHEHRLALCSIKKATELYHKMTGNEQKTDVVKCLSGEDLNKWDLVYIENKKIIKVK